MKGVKGSSQYIEELERKHPEFRDHIHKLNDRLRFVIERRLQGQTLAAIAPGVPRTKLGGGGVGVTREKVRQLEFKATWWLGWYCTILHPDISPNRERLRNTQ